MQPSERSVGGEGRKTRQGQQKLHLRKGATSSLKANILMLRLSLTSHWRVFADNLSTSHQSPHPSDPSLPVSGHGVALFSFATHKRVICRQVCIFPANYERLWRHVFVSAPYKSLQLISPSDSRPPRATTHQR